MTTSDDFDAPGESLMAPGLSQERHMGDDESSRDGPVRRFLLHCSGAEPSILADSRTEQIVFATLGGTVLTTGVMAGISVTFALSIALGRPWYYFLPAALIWGMIIFNLDRYLISSYRRMPSWHLTLVSVVPRVVLAAFFGMLIAEPVILAIFSPEIAEEIVVMTREDLSEATTALLLGPVARERADNLARIEQLRADRERIVSRGGNGISEDPALTHINAEITALGEANRSLGDRIADTEAELAVAQAAYTEEVASGCANAGAGRACRPGFGPIAQQKLENRDARQATLDNILRTSSPVIAENQARIVHLRTRIDERLQALVMDSGELEGLREQQVTEMTAEIENLSDRNATLTADLDQAKAAIESSADDGLLDQLRALGRLQSSDGMVRKWYFLLTALFVAIDVLPIVGKWLYSIGDEKPYEHNRDVAEKLSVLKQDTNLAIAQARQTGMIDIFSANERHRVAATTANEQDLINYGAAIQRNIGRAQLSEWEIRNLLDGYEQFNPSSLPESSIRTDGTDMSEQLMLERKADAVSHGAGSQQNPAGGFSETHPRSDRTPIRRMRSQLAESNEPGEIGSASNPGGETANAGPIDEISTATGGGESVSAPTVNGSHRRGERGTLFDGPEAETPDDPMGPYPQLPEGGENG